VSSTSASSSIPPSSTAVVTGNPTSTPAPLFFFVSISSSGTNQELQ
jgi:hypothetical protein